MKKAMVISIFCAVFLSGCGNVSESAERENSSVASQTTTTAIVSAKTSAKEEIDTSETTATIKKSSQTVSSSSKPTDTEVTAVKKSSTSNQAAIRFRSIITLYKVITKLCRIILHPTILRTIT